MVGLIFFLIIGVSALEGVNSYRTLAWYLITTVFIEAFILLFITPAITAGTVSLEKERQTLDVLLTTRMTTWEIIKGKYGSDFILLSFMVVSTFPLLAIVVIMHCSGFAFSGIAYHGRQAATAKEFPCQQVHAVFSPPAVKTWIRFHT